MDNLCRALEHPSLQSPPALHETEDLSPARLHHTVNLVIKRSLHPLIRDAIIAEIQ
jgi:hypothetical protein